MLSLQPADRSRRSRGARMAARAGLITSTMLRILHLEISRRLAQPQVARVAQGRPYIALSSGGEWPCQAVTSPVTCSGSRERYEFVGLPGYLLSVRLGSSVMGPVGSTM